MDFAILGPVDVRDADGLPVAIAEGKQRALLAALLVNANHAVSADRLIDLLWGEDAAPETAARTLHAYISRLRHALGDEPADAGRIQTRGHGYVIHVEADELDMIRFERLLSIGHRALSAGDPATAADRIRQGLALWRGPPLPELCQEGAARTEVAHLEEERLDAIEERVEADLELGRHADVVAELTDLTAAYPFRETFLRELMIALYRCERQAEALAVCRRARAMFAEDLGIELGEELSRLEQAILRHDPTLEWTGTPPAGIVDDEPDAAPGRAPPEASPRRWTGWVRRYHPVVISVALPLLLLATLMTVVVRNRTPTEPRAVLGAGGLIAQIDPSRDSLAASTEVGAGATRVVFSDGSVWVTRPESGVVERMTTTGGVQGLPTGGAPTAIAAAPGAVWVVDSIGHRLDEIRPSPLGVVMRVALPAGAHQVIAGLGWIWVIDELAGTLERVDPATGNRRTFTLRGHVHPQAGVAAAGALWITAGSSLLKVDPSDGKTERSLRLPFTAGDVVYGFGSLWVAYPGERVVTRVDPVSGRLTRIEVGDGPVGIAVGDGSVWVADRLDGTVSRIDPRTDRVIASIDVGGEPRGIAEGDGAVWVSVTT